MTNLRIGFIGQAKPLLISDLEEQTLQSIMEDYRIGKGQTITIRPYLAVTRASLAYMVLMEDS